MAPAQALASAILVSSFLLRLSNSLILFSSWVNTFITLWPFIISSMYPFTTPRSFCWALKYAPDFFPRSPVAKSVMKMKAMTTKRRIQLFIAMDTRTIKRVMAAVRSCTRPLATSWFKVSVSLAKRLMMEPLLFLSK